MNSIKKIKFLEEKIIYIYIITIFSVFPVFLIADKMQNVTFRWLLYCILTMITAGTCIFLLLQKKINCRKRFYKIDICMITLLILSIGQAIICVFKGEGNKELYYLICISILAYFILSVFSKQINDLILCLDLLLIAYVVVYLELFVRLFIFPQFNATIELLIQDKTVMRAFLFLGVMVSILQYCINRKAKKDIWYLATAAAGFFMVAIQKEIIGALMIGVLFLIIPLLFLPTVELFKRNFIMAFMFFFILSSIAIMTNYTNVLKADVQFNLLYSVYLDLAIAVIGILVFSYWGRIPDNIPSEKIVMKRMQKNFFFLFKLYVIFLGTVWCIEWPEGLTDRLGSKVFLQFVSSLKNELNHIDGTPVQMLREYGLIGIIVVVILCAMIISRVRKNYEYSTQSAILTTIAVMFIVQSFFYKQQIVTTPVYTVLVTSAVFWKKRND